MSTSLARILIGVAGFLAVCGVGSLGYMAAGWSALDAIYMVIITIFGVGYGEVNAVDSAALRGFTIGVIIAGYVAAVYVVGAIVQLVTEGEIHRALGDKRTMSGIEGSSGHVIVCGYGRIGRILCEELREAQVPMVLIDTEEETVAAARERGFLALKGDATDEKVLLDAGIERARALAAVLPEDAQNVFVALTASGIAPDLRIVARAEDPATEPKLLRSGATDVVLPTSSGAERMADLIAHPDVATMLETLVRRAHIERELSGIGLQLEQLIVPERSRLVGASVRDIEIGGNHGFLIVGLRSPDGEFLVNPPDDTPIVAGHTVIVVGHTDDLPVLKGRFELQRERTYRGVRY